MDTKEVGAPRRMQAIPTAGAPQTSTPQLPLISNTMEKSNSSLEECIAGLEALNTRLSGDDVKEEVAPHAPLPAGAIPALERELEIFAALIMRLNMVCTGLNKLA